MDSARIGTVAIVIHWENEQPVLLDQFSDDGEIATFEAAAEAGAENPLQTVYERRGRLAAEEDEFGDYVEELLSRPGVRSEVQEHGIQWLRSRIKIEMFQQSESEASQVIAEYAFRAFREDPTKTDFLLAGPAARVRVRVLVLPPEAMCAA